MVLLTDCLFSYHPGSFGTVYKGKCRQKEVAVKVLLKQDYDEKTLEAFRHEVEVMSKIFHPNVNLVISTS
jgi:serine/threonine protein kinase